MAQELSEYMRSQHFANTLRHMFFEAMLAGYANDAEKSTLPGFPGAKAFDHSTGAGWRVLDTYIVSPYGNHSGGTTIIWYEDQPVWMMQYMGHYPKECIPCLRSALRDTYEKHLFIGGRGPEHFTHDGFSYHNTVKASNFYGDAFGQEIIFSDGNAMLGHHEYQSTYLLDELRADRRR